MTTIRTKLHIPENNILFKEYLVLRRQQQENPDKFNKCVHLARITRNSVTSWFQSRDSMVDANYKVYKEAGYINEN